jgi:hypothetical protein
MNPIDLSWEELVCPSPEWTSTWPRLIAREKESQARGQARPISEWQLKCRLRYIAEHYEVLDISGDQGKVQVECPNKENHSTDTGDGQTIVFTGADEVGVPTFFCSHAHCKDFAKEESGRLRQGLMAAETFVIHNQNERFNEMLGDFYGHLAEKGTFFRRSEEGPYAMWHWAPGMSQPITLTTHNLAEELGSEGILFSKPTKKGLVECMAGKEAALSILQSGSIEATPIAKTLVKNPLLVKTNEGAKMVSNSYCPELETIILGNADEFEEVPFGEGVKTIDSLLDYWLWKEPGDRARAWAELLTPALLQGGFMERPIPAMLMMADFPDAGKTFWHKTVAWIYQHELDPRAYGKTTISGLEEQLNFDLDRGVPFFFIDELEGGIKSTFINAFITGGKEKSIRNAYSKMTTVSTEKLVILLAGVKGFVIDPQLASRTIPIRILRHSSQAEWLTPEGEILKFWIERNAKRLLSSIYAVIAEWARRGFPTTVPDSRFPGWSAVINGILGQVLNLVHATEGLEDLQAEVSNPAAEWIPEALTLLEEEGLLWCEEGAAKLFNPSIVRLIVNEGGLGVPGVNTSLRDDDLRKAQNRQIGKIISLLPKARTSHGRDPIFRFGDRFLIRYSIKNARHARMDSYYVLGRSATIPEKTEHYVSQRSFDGTEA